MPLSKNEKHLKSIRQLPCVIPFCGAIYCEAHHLLITPDRERGMGMKSGDNWAIPLCAKHHRQLHANGDEIEFFDIHGVDHHRMQKLAQYRWWRTCNEGKEKVL
jgi:hypothetical protein